MSKKAPPEFGDESGPSLHSARWRFGEFELDETRRELSLRGELLKIEAKPLNLLMLFLRHPGELITKNDLIDALWTGRIVTEAVLGNCVAKLRQVLGDEGAAWIKTVFGFGYRFDVEAQLIVDDAVSIAPPKLAFEPGDAPPMRPNWRLVRRLGRSGDSWLAEHVKTRAQRVFKFTTELHGLSALKREVTVYRLLHESLGDKACYVDLLDWNFDEPPWFVEAEYCAAGSLQEWFAAQGGVERVPLPTRLELIAQIAEALAEIHAVGVLHKDLKPANVFVVIDNDGRPTIRLGDFGSSRLYDSEYLARLQITKLGFTQVLDPNQGESSGTPLYLAPEVQAGQPATVKADIYALGVMLYQFVIGNLARRLEAGWEAIIDDEILREDIGATASGDPQRRLADLRELARKLRAIEARRLARKAEHAAKENAERAARALERIKARRVGLMAAFAALTIGFVASAWLYVDARKAREVAEAETRRAEGEAARARAVGEFLAGGMFASINDDVKKVREMSVKELVDRAVSRIPSQFESDPAVKAELHAALGGAYAALEYNPAAEAQLAEADALLVRTFGRVSAKRIPVAAKRVTLSFGTGQLLHDLPAFEALAAEVATSDAESQLALARLQMELLRAQGYLGRHDKAVKIARQLLTTSAAEDPLFRSGVERLLGNGLFEISELHAARQVLLSAQTSEARSLASGLVSRPSIGLLCNLSMVEIELGLFESARLHIQTAEIAAADWLRPGSGWPNYIQMLKAKLMYQRGEKAEAVAAMESALAMIRADESEADHSAGLSIYLAEIYNYERRYGEANRLTARVVGMLSKLVAPDSIQIARVKQERAIALAGLGKKQQAEALLAEVDREVDAEMPRNSPFFLRSEVARQRLQPLDHSAPRSGQAVAQLTRKLSEGFHAAHPLIQLAAWPDVRVARSQP